MPASVRYLLFLSLEASVSAEPQEALMAFQGMASRFCPTAGSRDA